MKACLSTSSKLSILLLAAATLPSVVLANGNECKPEEFLLPSVETQRTGKAVVDEMAILNEEHSLRELIVADPSKNLAYQHPTMVMNATQVIASWINSAGVRSIPDPEFGSGRVNFYNLFSGGIPEVNGKSITGQFEAIQAVADNVFAAARGDGSASKIAMLLGPAGTGKSYFLEILSDFALSVSATDPDYFMYSYEFTGLKDIPELRAIVNLQEGANGEVFEHPTPCPLHESPINLLPKAYSDQVVSLVKDRATKMAKARPTPARNVCPHCQHIREVLYKKYMNEKGVKTLSPMQQVEAVEPYVRIKRFVVGKDGGMAKLDAEAKDVDYAGLLVAPNALVFNTFGPSHPFSYFLNGKILQGSRGLVVFDEFFRSDEGFRNQTLNITEQKVVRRGGAPAVSLDIMTLAASNYESLAKAAANGGSKAQIDRTRLIPMRYLLNPVFEAQNLLKMKGMKSVLAQDLTAAFDPVGGDGDGGRLIPHDDANHAHGAPSIGLADIKKLFPLPQAGEAPIGPDHVFKLWFDVGPHAEPVHLSPHTLMYMAMTVTGSRLVTDQAKALKFGAKAVVNDAAFKDIYTRLLVYMGRYKNLNASDLADLRSLSRDLKEGDEGISERDAANVWLTQAIAEAQRPENGNCLTPDLARRVFLKLLEDGAIQYPNQKTRAQWTLISEEILLKHVVRELQQDVNTALGAGLGAVQGMYDEIFQELSALAIDKGSREYQSSNGELRPINVQRLGEIMAIFQATQHRGLNPGEVMALHATQGMKTGSDRQRHQGLLAAVKDYLARRTTDMVTFEDIYRFTATGEGSAGNRQKAGELGHIMTQQLGYCPHCIRQAMLLAKQAMSRTQQVVPPQH